MQIDSITKPRAEQPAAGTTTVQDAPRPADALPPLAAPPRGPVTPRTQTPEPTVLNRLIRILRVDRADSGNTVALTITVRAQVGERELDAAATAISVQFFARDSTGRPVAASEPLGLRIPRWENFTVQTFSASFPGPAAQLAGYVVRTYYRQQLQDVAAVPPALLATAPHPAP
jgi:hypothetical protein